MIVPLSTPKHPHLLVFDSGVGGLSVAREVLKAHPQCRLTYASDNRYFPYGEKTEDVLIERVEQVIEALIEQTSPDIVVMACNTASTVTLPCLRQRFAIPFVGVVPAIKPAALHSRTKVIGVLATPATISRAYTQQLVEDHARDCQVVLHGSGALVRMAENKLMGLPVDLETVARELSGLTSHPAAKQMDTVVLACTHFPLLRRELEEVTSPSNFTWIDSGEAIARRVGYWLERIAQNPAPYSGDRYTEEPYTKKYGVIMTASSPHWPALEKHLPGYLGGHGRIGLAVLEI